MIKGFFKFPASIRLIHTSSLFRAVDKASLSKLRKRTGISFINCKKALEKFENDVDQAEGWLKEEAQKQGWEKATKLGGRTMSSGLIGVRVDGDLAAMVEINCETDFVARNKKFQNLVSQISNLVLQQGKESDAAKIYWERDEFNKLSSSNKTISDMVAMEVGSLGENMAAKRGVVIRAGENFKVGHYVHAIGAGDKESGQCSLGKYASVIRYRQTAPVDLPKFSLEEAARQLCQHIVGMNPTSVGSTEDEPSESKDNESKMIHQEYLLDPSLTVNEVLEQNCIKIDDFVRFECGDILESEKPKEELKETDAEARQQA
ncbi:elongation factor Ts, mitochondrial-like isoform X2 [Lineus longissimus]|uniref:elongation factor Ts, mitochondrial-like isoform X2 n=1 Tax=Lineus longissimus TaxID=88925 RepID=UPI002B4DAB3E